MFTPEVADKLISILKQAGVSEETCAKVAEEMKSKTSSEDEEEKTEASPVEEPKALVAVVARKPNPLEEMLKW